MSFAKKVTDALAARSKELGRKLRYPTEWHEVIDRVYLDSTKERKKASIHENADAIFNLYPRREGGLTARAAITKAIEKYGFQYIVERTTDYANAVAKWPRMYRYAQAPGSEGKDLCPMASTWYNQERYNDDPANWHRTGGREAPKKQEMLIEPNGWRDEFPDFINASKPWEELSDEHRYYISEQMKKLKQTA